MKLTPTRIKILKNLRRAVKAGLKPNAKHQFHMRDWVEVDIKDGGYTKIKPNAPIPEGMCNTVACLAGTIALQDGWKPFAVYVDAEYKDIVVDFKKGRRKVISDDLQTVAAKKLGLTEDESDALFAPGWSSSDYANANNIWHGLKPYSKPADALIVIDRLLAGEPIVQKSNDEEPVTL